MIGPLNFQTEGRGFESHQGHLLFSYFFWPRSLKNAQILMNVMFFGANLEISTRGTFSSIAAGLKNDGQRVPCDQELDGPS